MMEEEEEKQPWLAPTGNLAKRVLKKGSGFETPQEGALCHVRILEDPTNLLRGGQDGERQLVLGEAECRAEQLLELCLRTMKQEEECEFFLLKSALISIIQPDVKLVHKTTPPHYVQEAAQDGGSTLEPQHDSSQEKTEEEAAMLENNEKLEGGDTNIHDSTDSDDVKAAAAITEEIPSSQQEESGSTVANFEEAKSEEQAADSKESTLFSENEYAKTRIILDAFTREPEIWEMSITEKTRRFNHHKDRGVQLYALKEYEWAFLRFSKAIKYLISVQYEIPEDDQLPPELGYDMKMACYLNLAACQLKHRNYDHAVVNCTKALEIDPDNPKALYRRGTGYIHLQEYERAKIDLDKALEMEPNRKAIQRQQIILKARVQKLNQYYAKCMKKLFN